MSRKSKINNVIPFEIKNNNKENSYEIKETEQYRIDSIKEREDSSQNKDSKNRRR